MSPYETPPLAGATRFFSQDWEQRLKFVVDMMRDISRVNDPQQLIAMYGARMRQIIQYDVSISLSRRDLVFPHVRVTRSSTWTEAINPWTQRQRLPLISSGLLTELIYKEDPTIENELNVSPDDPAYEYFGGMKSLFAIPMYDGGKSQNMVVTASRHPHYYPPQYAPEFVWLSNLFGRATNNLVLSAELQKAYDIVDRELKVVADIQRSLLPTTLPEIPGLDLAAHYSTSQQAGGDYYDFFPLSDGRWGILIADVAGHGTPAAVLMAVTHSIAHSFPGSPTRPGEMLAWLNQKLAARYTADKGTFITAFYGMYDPKTRRLDYASAGHNPPRVKSGRDGSLRSLDRCGNLPLGIEGDETYLDACETLQSGDAIVFYTDGITETRNRQGELFGTQRLDQVLTSCTCKADNLIEKTLAAVNEWGGYLPAVDDRTLVVARIT